MTEIDLEPLTPQQADVYVLMYRGTRSAADIGRALGIGRNTAWNSIKRLKRKGYINRDNEPQMLPLELSVNGEWSPNQQDPGFESPELPSQVRSLGEILDDRVRSTERMRGYQDATKLIPIKVKMDGPIGILHMGDPHVDDDGSDIVALKQDVALVQQTEGLFAANIGDQNNNWVGRLGHLHGKQGVRAEEAWILVEWLISAVGNKWLYLIKGNHDVWSDDRDPIKWMTRGNEKAGPAKAWRVRLGLEFPNGRQIRVQARHDFPGNSMWNVSHGASRAFKMGWQDHIMACGHRHSSGAQILKSPDGSLLCWAFRLGTYKFADDYAEAKGFDDQIISPSVMTIIDPSKEDNDPAQIQLFHSVELGARFLTFLREEHKKAKKAA